MNWIQALKILGPAILAVVPGAQPFAPLILAGMELAERTKKPGEEKKALAKEWTKLGAETANTAAKREVLNPDLAEKIADDSIDAIVGIVNAAKQIRMPDSPKVEDGKQE